MQMKKNYLLLFLIALLFGTATMRGQSLPLNKLDGFSTYYIKVGNGYIHFPNATDIKCTPSQSEAAKCKLAPNQSEGLIESITTDDSHTIRYGNTGKIGQKKSLFYLKFSYVADGGKYYLKAAQGDRQTGRYLTNKAGTLSFEDQKSNDAVVEITNINGASPTEATLNAEKRLKAFALFQKVRHGNDAFDSPIMGNGLGQYTHSNPPLALEDKNLGSSYWEYATLNMYKAGHDGFSAANVDSEMRKLNKAIGSIKINPLETGKFVVISTKSLYEDAVRDNTKIFQTRVVIDNVAGPKQAAKYLKATATGYTLTSTKAEAAVFFFDGNHLTGLDYGFGLNTTQNKYTLSEAEQKAVVAQGKLEKTLDAGSYSLKVGNKFVKLDNAGLSVTDNESESHIFLEEATEFKLNTDALGYVSFFAPTAVELPTGVEVYTGKLNAQNSVVNLKKVNTTKIPANTAVLLRKGTSKTSFTVKKIASAPAITDNSLKGYTVSSNQRVANAYGFAVQGNKLVFIPLTDGVRAFKAVIFNGNAAGMQEFIPAAFVPTGIEGVTVEENKEEIFDLTGRRVESPVKGQIYVKGGKKFIQK
jgi:hypothetical protein